MTTKQNGNGRKTAAHQNSNSNKGFSSMDPAKQREIASEGGRAAHEKGTAHEFDSEEAKEAGRKGGQSHANQNDNSSENDDRSNRNDSSKDSDNKTNRNK